jgi:hypothetical protein
MLWRWGLAAVVLGTVGGLLAWGWLGLRQAPHFADIFELQSWARARGLYCQSDRRDGKILFGMALSRQALSWEDAGRLCKAPGPGWEGVIWAAPVTPTLAREIAPPWSGECRVWGGVIATDEPRMFDRLDMEGRVVGLRVATARPPGQRLWENDSRRGPVGRGQASR